MTDKNVKSATRVLSLFEFYALNQQPATISELAEGLEMPQSSTSMLVKSLVDLGYLDHDTERRTYTPNMRITLLGTWLNRRFHQTGEIPKRLAQLRTETGETVVLAMRNQIYAQYIFVHEAADPLRLHVESGNLRPLTTSAPGRVFLAQLPNEEIGRIVRRSNTEFRKNWRQPLGQVLNAVRETRRHGYATTQGDTTPGAGAIAVGVPSQVTNTPLAISVGGPTERIEEKHDFIVDCLTALVSDLSADSVRTFMESEDISAKA